MYGLISVFSVINIFSTITSSILLKKREIAELKSLGMSNKQINKMLFLEGIFYGLNAIIYGVIISLIILYLMYLFMENTKLYLFIIPWKHIIICIATIYLTIFITMINAKNKIKNKNIIEEIKNENI